MLHVRWTVMAATADGQTQYKVAATSCVAGEMNTAPATTAENGDCRRRVQGVRLHYAVHWRAVLSFESSWAGDYR